MSDLMEHQSATKAKPSSAQRRYLERGLSEPGGKLPLFDQDGQRIKDKTIRSCLSKGWCEPWYRNPIKPDWLVCKLTSAGRAVLGKEKR
ncbi:hypothetical protein ACFO5Q_17490 [Kordiimonas lipolytica]|uniref:Uncharacterized protein n=1 Tax=Kordiimonas lipolytica TaxID=1662421 RepID=A0ABV8UGR1_9PROT|nr:hypothetical protein [Kordiimonas lipolytica]